MHIMETPSPASKTITLSLMSAAYFAWLSMATRSQIPLTTPPSTVTQVPVM